MESIIETRKLFKQYRDVKAVQDLNLHVGKNEIYVLLGLNGAGKTTTIRMLLGMIGPSSGSAWITGNRVSRNNHALWEKTGHMVEIPYSYPNLTVYENLEIIRRLRLLKNGKATDRIIDMLELGPYRNRKAKQLSQGNKQRLGLAKALIHKPEILILDEPTSGLDPAGIFSIRELFIDLAKNHGVTIFLSSHILSEVSVLADRIGIIHHGRMIRELDRAGLNGIKNKHLFLEIKNTEDAIDLLRKNGYNDIEADNKSVKIRDLSAINDPGSIVTLLVNNNNPPSGMYVSEENLETYFLRTIGNKETE